MGDYADHVAGAAAAIAFLTPRVDEVFLRESIAFDLGQAVENAMLAAWELRIGSCHASVYDEPRVRRLLEYPPELTCDLVVSFGYPADGRTGADRPTDRWLARAKRKPLHELVELR